MLRIRIGESRNYDHRQGVLLYRTHGRVLILLVLISLGPRSAVLRHVDWIFYDREFADQENGQ